MRVLIDEDTAVACGALRHVLIGHEVDHIIGRNWSGRKDRNVLRDAKQARYQVIITRDRSQFDDPDECDVIKKSGLHHVRYGQRHQGAHGLALALSAIIAAMPMVIRQLEGSSSQMLVRIVALEPERPRRYEIRDPRTDPPSAYWPR